MAAYESWAGGKVGAGPDATSWSLKPRGGYIPLGDIPNAPKTVEMPLAKYQAIPSIRHEYVKQDIDMESRAQKLMQKPLPGSFEEAGNIRTEAAGKGQAAWGKAIEAGGKEFNTAIGAFANSLARLHGEAVKSKDETDTYRYDQLENLAQQKINAIPTTLPPEKWQAEREKIVSELQANASKLGLSNITKTRIQTRAGTVDDWSKTHLQIAGDEMSLRQDRDFHIKSIEENRQNGKTGNNAEHYSYLKEKGYWTDDTVKLEKEKDAQVDSVGNFNIAKVNNPRGAMNEAKVVMDGGTSKDFPHLNKANSANFYVDARNATRVKDQQTAIDLSTQFANGQITDPKEVKRRAQTAGLPDEDVLKLTTGIAEYQEKARRDAEANIKSDPAAIVATRKLITDYDGNNDADGKKFIEGVAFINGHIEPELRGHFIDKLKAKTPESMAKKDSDAVVRDREAESLRKEIHDIGNKGYQFKDDKKRSAFNEAEKALKEGKKKLTPDQWAIWREGNQWIDDKLNEVDSAVSKEPDFAPGELRKQIREKLATEVNISSTSPAAPPPPATLNTGALAPTKEQIAAAPTTAPSQWVATAPRNVKSENAAFQKAFTSGGEAFEIKRVTAYTPGKGKPSMEGKNETLDRPGEPAYTFEGYQRGTFPWVSAAVDEKSELRGKFFISPAYPNVVFKGEDIGPAFAGKGTTAFDVAFEDERKQGNYEVKDITVRTIGEDDALAVSGAYRRGGGYAGGGYTGGVQPALISKVDTLRQQFPGMGKINSGFRDPEHNKEVGGAKDSEHTRGDAVDIDVSGMSVAQRRQLIRAASLSGIKGIGIYHTALHFDLGEKYGARAWGHSHRRGSVPAWAESEVQEHERRYRVG